MKIKNIKYLQQGGPMSAPDAAAAPEMGAEAGGNDAAMQQIAQMAGQIIQQMGPEAAMMLAQAIMEMVQGGQQEAPVFKAGGKLKCGGNMKAKAKRK